MPSPRGILENFIGGLLGLGAIALVAWGISHLHAPITLWVVFLIAVVAALLGFGLGRISRYGDELFAYQSDLIGEAMQGLREVVAGNLNVSFEDFVERGVLAPARFGLSAERGEEIRISVLEPTSGGDSFKMTFESGHSLGRKDNFSLPRVSLAGHALETGELQWSNDVASDDRWHPHPRASDSRGYRSLACMPIVVGEDAVAVLNVVSSAKGAFLSGDLMYIDLLGSFIGLAWAHADGADVSNTLEASQGPEAPDRKGT